MAVFRGQMGAERDLKSSYLSVLGGGVIGPPEEYSDIPRPRILITLPTQADHTDPIAT